MLDQWIMYSAVDGHTFFLRIYGQLLSTEALTLSSLTIQ